MTIAITTAAVAQQPPRPRTGALGPGGTGLVAGRVVDPASGHSVPEAVVWLLVDGILRDESPRFMTDPGGRFAFVNVPAGRYGLYAEKLGYRRGLYGQKDVLDSGRNVDVGDGQLIADVQLPIWKNATIGGTVTDEAGEPVVGVSVRAFRKVVTFGEIRFTPGFQSTTGTTDDRGEYRLSSLVPGEYLVAVPSTLTTFPAEIMPDLLGRSDVSNVAMGAISELAPLGSPRNQQVAGSVIMATSRTLIPPASASDVAAVYRTTLFPAATKLGDATTFTLKPGEERSGADISLRPVRAASVSGQIVGPEGATGPTVVRLLPAGDAMLSGSREFDVATGLSDAAGRFTLLGIPEGQYVMWIEKRLPTPGQPPETWSLLFGSEPVTVSSSGAPEARVTLRPAPRISIRLDVRDGATVKPQDMELLIEPVGAGGRAFLSPDSTKPSVIQMAPGRYVVTPAYFQGSCTAALFQGRDVSDEPLVLGTDDAEITVVCGNEPTRLSGTVRNERGAVDPDALVVVFPADRRFWSGAGLRVRRKVSAHASASGTFSITNLPAGDYLVAALPAAGSDFWQDPIVLEVLSSSATRVSFGPGESRTMDVRTARLR